MPAWTWRRWRCRLSGWFLVLLLSPLGLRAQAAGDRTAQGYLLVVTKQSHALAMIDGRTLQPVAHIPIGEDPHEVVVGPDGRTAWVSNWGNGTLATLQRIDLPNRRALQPFGTAPLVGIHGVFVQGPELWFTATSSLALGMLELGARDPMTARLTAVLGTGQLNSHLVWVSADGNRVVASNAGSATLSIFTRTPPSPAPDATILPWTMRIVPTGPGAEGFAVSPDEREAWVGDEGGILHVIDLASGKETATLPLGAPGINRLRFTPDGAMLLVTTHFGPELLVVDPHARAVTHRIPIEQHGASAIQLDPAADRAFVSAPRDHFVAVVDLHTLRRVATIDAGREPDGLTWWTPPRQAKVRP